MTISEAKSYLRLMDVGDWKSFPVLQTDRLVTSFVKRIDERYWRLNGCDERGLMDMAELIADRCAKGWMP